MVNERKSVPYNAADYLKTQEDCAHYLEAALDDGDERVLMTALRNVAQALSATSGESVATVFTLSAGACGEDSHPRLATVLNMLHLLGFELSVRPKQAA